MKTLPVLLLVAACGGSAEVVSNAPSGPVSDTITLMYQSRVDGEIEPCG
ncbi:MAG: hypothetical protein GWP91_00300 [Rhodobacterales bacterium]|nr:hypothetical protein [Rhodobacterales bacterium]